jgi:hypothetical protein
MPIELVVNEENMDFEFPVKTFSQESREKSRLK